MQEYINFFNDNLILCVVWAVVLVTLIMTTYKAKVAGYKIIEPNDAVAFINREDGVVVDVRSHDEFSHGHIAGSVNVLPSDIKADSLGAIEKYKSTPIIVVCKLGQVAADNANLLSKAGFEKVFILKSGIASWQDAKLPLVTNKPLSKKSKK